MFIITPAWTWHDHGNLGEQTWRFDENDVFVVSSWHALRLRADRDTLLFGFSDRPVQQALGLWREQRL